MADQLGKVTLVGFEDLIQALQVFPQQFQDQVVAGGMSYASARLRTKMRRRVPVKSGNLRKAIRVKRIKNQGRGLIRYLIGLGSRYYYETLDQGRQPYVRTNKYGTKFRVAGTPRLNTVGTGIEESIKNNKDVMLLDLKTRAEQLLIKKAGQMYARSKAKSAMRRR